MEKVGKPKVVGIVEVGKLHPHFQAAVEDIRSELKRLNVHHMDLREGISLKSCTGFIYVGEYKRFPAFIGAMRDFEGLATKGVKKIFGIFEGSGGSCKPFVASFQHMPGVYVIADSHPENLVRRICEAM